MDEISCHIIERQNKNNIGENHKVFSD